MQVRKRARSKSAKSERKDTILVAAETLLRQSGHEVMTMQAVAQRVASGKERYIYIFLVGSY